MRNEWMYMRWQRNVWLVVAVILLIFAGWQWVRSWKLQNELEGFEITQFEPMGGNPYDR